MGDVMPKEQAEWIADTQKYCLGATNMTEQEAYNFAFRCWQLGFEKKKHTARGIFEEIEKNTTFTINFVEAIEFESEEIRKAKLECYRDCLGYFVKLEKKYTGN